MNPAVISAHDLFCLYPASTGHVAALRGMTLDLAPGERLVVHGPNGSGKTTLLRVLTGEQPASAGTVTVAGVDLIGAPPTTMARLRARHLGIVEQQRSLRPELTVLENVALQSRLSGTPRRQATAAASALLAELGLADLAARSPATLSGGEAQRVAVCAALAHHPTILLADEPTGELDRAAANQVYDLLATATTAVGAALLLVTHDANAARIADRVVRIRDGRLSEEWRLGHPETLVVDDRGWVRLPAPLRRTANITRTTTPTATPESLTLTPPPTAPKPTPTTVTNTPMSPTQIPKTHPDTTPNSSPSCGINPTVVPQTPNPALRNPPPPPGVGGRVTRAGIKPDRPERVTRPPTPPNTASADPPAQLRNITVQRGDRTLITDLTLTIHPAHWTILKGCSGSGKTTLLRVLAGLERPTQGTVEIAGTDIETLDRAQRAALRRTHMSVAGQRTALVETQDVVTNLRLARMARGLDPQIGVEALIGALGLSGVRHRPVEVLSGGERQRVAVARALACGTSLVLLDEPTSQQDEAHAELVAAALRDAAFRGIAVVVATHDPALLPQVSTHV